MQYPKSHRGPRVSLPSWQAGPTVRHPPHCPHPLAILTCLTGILYKSIEVPYSSGTGVQGFCVVTQLRSWGPSLLVFLHPWCFLRCALPGSFLALSWQRSSPAPSIWRPCIPFCPAHQLGGQQPKATGNAVIHVAFTEQQPGQVFLKCGEEAGPHAGVHVCPGGAGPWVLVVISSQETPFPLGSWWAVSTGAG